MKGSGSGWFSRITEWAAVLDQLSESCGPGRWVLMAPGFPVPPSLGSGFRPRMFGSGSGGSGAFPGGNNKNKPVPLLEPGAARDSHRYQQPTNQRRREERLPGRALSGTEQLVTEEEWSWFLTGFNG